MFFSSFELPIQIKESVAKILYKLHLRTKATLLIAFLTIHLIMDNVHGSGLFSSTYPFPIDTAYSDAPLHIQRDTLGVIDTASVATTPSQSLEADTLTAPTQPDSPLSDPVFSNAEDSIRYSIDGQKVYLYGNAVVTYQNIELQAAYISFNMATNVVFARGMPDSTGLMVGKPIFKEGEQTFRMDSMFYNFDTKRAKISGIITEEGGGFLHSRETKLMEDRTINVLGGKFTTCDADHPHFYIAITKAKALPNKSIISGPAYLVIADVPFPLAIPFGFFPNTTNRASGIIMPRYGEENQRGFFISDGGVYLGISDHIDMHITGSIYSKGSWSFNTRSAYRMRYRYSGSFAFALSENVLGEKGLEGYSKSQSYSLRWNHSQDPKANPNSTFQAGVNFSSPNFNRFNANSINDFHSNSLNSSISYSKVWPGTPFSFSASMNHSQNNRDSSITLGLPRASLTMTRIFPFKPKNLIGPPAWYHKIGLSYSTSFDNSIATKTDRLFTAQSLRQFRNGMKHDIPISTSFNLFKYITVSPSASYTEYWYLRTMEKRMDHELNRLVTDTVEGFARAYQFNTGVSASTKLFGMFIFNQNSYVQAIRHVLTPSISLGYRPDFSHPRFGFFRDLPSDLPDFNYIRDWENLGFYRDFYEREPGRTTRYSIFEQGVYGGPGGGQSGTIGFSLGNNLEMKVRSRSDTTDTKVKILESLNFSTSYNLLADSLNLSPISVSGRTTLFGTLSINFGGTLDPYALDEQGRVFHQFHFKEHNSPVRLTSARVSFGYSFSGGKAGNGDAGDSNRSPDGATFTTDGDATSPEDMAFRQSLGSTHEEYVDFSVPWSLRADYSFNYRKPGHVQSVNQSLTFSGDLSLTPKWRIGFSSGLDIKNMQLTTTSLNFYRDLHCWAMRLTVVPIGTFRSFSFQINVKSAVLQDLKLTRRSSHLDNF